MTGTNQTYYRKARNLTMYSLELAISCFGSCRPQECISPSNSPDLYVLLNKVLENTVGGLKCISGYQDSVNTSSKSCVVAVSIAKNYIYISARKSIESFTSRFSFSSLFSRLVSVLPFAPVVKQWPRWPVVKTTHRPASLICERKFPQVVGLVGGNS